MKQFLNIRVFSHLNELVKFRNPGSKYHKEIKPGQTIKDLIEAMGIPHTEIYYLTNNSKSVTFGYILRDKDQIHVYPKMKHFHSELEPLIDDKFNDYKFIADVHLGKLAKHLRMLGFDCYYNNDLDDLKIIEIAIEDNRIILTRDKGILKFSKVKYGCLLRSHNPIEQLREVLERYELKDKIQPLIRCMECNEMTEGIAKEDILHRLEPKTRNYFNSFKICRKCDKIYWKGSHTDRMSKLINSIR